MHKIELEIDTKNCKSERAKLLLELDEYRKAFLEESYKAINLFLEEKYSCALYDGLDTTRFTRGYELRSISSLTTYSMQEAIHIIRSLTNTTNVILYKFVHLCDFPLVKTKFIVTDVATKKKRKFFGYIKNNYHR